MAAHQGWGSACVPGKHLPEGSTGAAGGAYECLDWYDTHDPCTAVCFINA